MKKLLIVVFIIAAVPSLSSAQKIDATKVPAAVKASFAKQFPGVSAKWEKEGTGYEAGFKKGGHTMSAVFQTDGTMEESEMGISVSELPAAVLSYIKIHYSGASVKESAKITKSSGEINYEAQVKGLDLIFDSNGNFIKQVKE